MERQRLWRRNGVHDLMHTFLTIVFGREPSTAPRALYKSDSVMDYRGQWAPRRSNSVALAECLN
jgi:hypothetical protein